ncbi:hypothetical protein [Chromobacterium subtsugae]|uniref:hypothetical protein n=2 Tax=Chromobacterium subtsugae TaxID=251747 RepID=UPI000804E97E|nr:hypothetical protein [Chromobacterium subtsugae]OBU87523.1 hypothetical protein MY55_05110 [Chromobacterium subtsugae]
MAVNGGFPIALRPQSAFAAVRVAAPAGAPSNPSGAAPLLDIKGLEVGTPESRYGFSMQTLQLLKQYDVRDMSGKDLDALSELMLARGEMDGDVSGTIRSDIQGHGWKTAGSSNALEIFSARRDETMASVKAGEVSLKLADFDLKGNARVTEALNKLAGIHDALQHDDSVTAAAEGGMSQAADIQRFDSWLRQTTRWRELGEAEPQPDAETIDAVGRVLQRLGISLAGEGNSAERMAQAWQAYQGWQAQHPGEQPRMDLQPPAETPAEPPRAAPAAAAVASTPAAAAKPAREAAPRFLLEAQYGMSLPMLQVLKSFDVANASVEQVKQLGRLLQDNGELSQDDADSLLPLTQRGTADSMNYYRRDLRWLADSQQHGETPQYRTPQGLVDLASPAGRARNDQQAQAVLDRLAALHQALQGDDRVQEAVDGGLQQGSDLAAFNAWAQAEGKGARSGDDAQPAFRNRQDVDGIFRTLQRLGVELTPQDGAVSPGQRLEQAWKDYQGWRASHPDAQPGLRLAPARRINDYA